MKKKQLLILTTTLLLISAGTAHQETNHGERTPEQIKNNHLDLLKQYDTNNNQTTDFQELLTASEDFAENQIQEYKLNIIETAYEKEITWAETPQQIKNNHLQLLKNYDTNNDQTIEAAEAQKAIEDKNNNQLTNYKTQIILTALNKEITWAENPDQSDPTDSKLQIRGKTLAGNYTRVKASFIGEKGREYSKTLDINGKKIESQINVADNSEDSVTVEGDIGSETFEAELGDVDRDFEDGFRPTTMYTWAEKAASVNGKDIYMINCAEHYSDSISQDKKVFVLAGEEASGNYPAAVFQAEVRNICGAWLGEWWGKAHLTDKELEVDKPDDLEGYVSSYIGENERVYLTQHTRPVASQQKNIEYELEIDTPSGTYRYQDVDLKYNGNLEIAGKTINAYDESLDGHFSDGKVTRIDDELYIKYMGKNLATTQFGFLYNVSNEQPETIEAEVEQRFDVEKGTLVEFGPETRNSFTVDRISSHASSVSIIPENPEADTSINGDIGVLNGSYNVVNFESGLHRVSVESMDETSATMKIVKGFSSDFSCEDYETGENEYKFCTNQGDEAVKEVDLGYGRGVDLNFVNNYYINNEIHTTFGGPEKTLTVTHGEGEEYREAEITVKEWKGLQEDENYKAIIQVEVPEREPEASLSFAKTSYTAGEQSSLTAIAEQEGTYRIEVEGPGVNQETQIESGSSTIEVQPDGPGTLQARAIAPGTLWNPLDNDRTVATASAEVREPVEGKNHQFGEKFTIQEGETTKIEGHDFYLSTLVGNDEDGYVSVLWRESEDGDTNSGLVLLKKVNSMGLQYSGGFEAYGTVCSIDPEAETAEIIVKQERFNPWTVCDRNPSELRGPDQADYELTDYELGEKVTLEEGEGLEFGESRAYLREIERYEDVFLNDGHLEWIDESSYWNPPTEGSSTINYFYEGRIATATCEASEDQLKLVMEDADEISQGEWPEDWCNEEERTGTEERSDNFYPRRGPVPVNEEVTVPAMTEFNIENTDTKIFLEKIHEVNNQEQVSFYVNRIQDQSEHAKDAIKGTNTTLNTENLKLEIKEVKFAETGTNEAKIIIHREETENEQNNQQETDTNETIENTMTLSPPPHQTGQEITVNIETRQKLAQNNYKIQITGPEEYSKTFSQQETSYTFTPQETGEYAIHLKPTTGLLGSITELITGSEALEQETITVTRPNQEKWKTYCTEQNYNTEQLNQQINCIEEEIVPQYFQNTAGDRPEIAQSLCQDLLGYNYNTEQTSCVNTE